MDSWNCQLFALFFALSSFNPITTNSTFNTLGKCKLSEFQCLNGGCIALAKYCDGKIDCTDTSDEPKLCSVCNRSIFGETGKTYELEIRTPQALPFVCHLNFTAPGGIYGDIIQLNFDKFNLGRFIPHSTSEGCLDGYMTIREDGLRTDGSGSNNSSSKSRYSSSNPSNNDVSVGNIATIGNGNGVTSKTSTSSSSTGSSISSSSITEGSTSIGGRWCGTAWGYTVYYSETHSINVTLQLEKLPQQNLGNNFEFKLSYKFLKKNDARLRYENGIWTGDTVDGSYCNKNLYDCDKRICRIRSPNFPGMYPRNVTCRYRIHQRTATPGQHAMIVVRQPDSQKVHIKELGPHFEENIYSLRKWDRCEQDFISIYDGRTTSSPELARLCGRGTVPEIISSGSDMLIEFRTSPYDSMFHPSPVSYLLGFELLVHINFVNTNSLVYVRQPNRCEFILNAFENPSGELESPHHSLAPNTICFYHFQGRRHETVWISFIKYHSTLDPALFEPPTECAAQLRIWDGKWSQTTLRSEMARNASLMAEICREEVPKLCSRTLIAKGTRPCSNLESYLSTGPDLTIEYRPNPVDSEKLYGPSTAFKLRYEFVDTSLGGAPLEPLPAPSAMPEPAALIQTQIKSCDRVYRSRSATRGIFRSPTNVFMYGRGGSTNISCTIRFEANSGESVRLSITRARFGGRPCQNVQNRSGRWHCNYMGGGFADLRISEIPWSDIPPLPRDCLCSDISGSLTLAPLAANIVEVKFTATQMGVDQDFRDFYFEGRFEFGVDGCETNWNERRLRGKSGDAYLRPSSCVPLIQPWLLEPDTEGGFLVLKMKGFWMPTMLQSAPPCPTDARITVYSTNNPKDSRDLCPSGPDVVAFSDGWDNAHKFNPVETSKSLIIEFRLPSKSGVEPFEYKFSWMEVYSSTECIHKCPELQACISPELWCDGIPHCPSGYDETPGQCNVAMPLSPLHVGLAAATLTILLSLAAGLAACLRRKNVEKKHLQNHLESNGRYPHHLLPPNALSPLYLDTSAKDSFC